ncbi:hypothetical protein MD484_g4506, partial [Candolleomyces efflorescens]
MVLLIPHAVLIGAILATYPYGGKEQGNGTTAPAAPSQPLSAAAEGSAPWQANIQAIQNLMGAVSDLFTLTEPHVHHFALSPAHFKDPSSTYTKSASSSSASAKPTANNTAAANASNSPVSPYTLHILVILTLTFPLLAFIVHLPYFPIRQVFLFGGLLPFVVTHPWVSRVLAAAGPYSHVIYTALYKHGIEVNNAIRGSLGIRKSKRRVVDPDAADIEGGSRKSGVNGQPLKMVLRRLMDDDRLTDKCWNSEMREVELWENESSNLTFSLAPGWSFVETEDWRKDLVGGWSGVGADNDGWVYTNDAWLGARPETYTAAGGLGSVTRRRSFTTTFPLMADPVSSQPAIPMHPLALPASGSGVGGFVPPSGANLASFVEDDVQAQDGEFSNEPERSESKKRREEIRLGKRPEHEGEGVKDDIPNVKPWSSNDPRVYAFPKAEAKPESDAWTICFDLGRKYDKERCDAWRDEVDKLLLFAALFSAVVTAFTVESYKLLEVDHEESTATLLVGIQRQLDNLVRQNTSGPALIPDPKAAFTAPPYAVHVNVCWFLSLMLSLSTVSIGILCLQWLREYQREANMTHQDAIALRYLRFHGLERWKVPSIIAGLPLLLQGALILFFAGMVIFLWNINKPVAIVVAIAVSTTVSFLLLTTILPPIQALLSNPAWLSDVGRGHAQCPYKSPQAWAIRPIVVGIAAGIAQACVSLGKRFKASDTQQTVWKDRVLYFRSLIGARDWSDNDMIVQQSALSTMNAFTLAQDMKVASYARGTAMGLAWIANMFTQNVRAIYAFIQCAEDVVPYHDKGMLSHMFTSEMGPDALAFVLPYMKTPPLSLSVPLKKDIFMAYALDYFALRNGQLRKPFFKYRFELFMRILNGAGTYLPDEEAPSSRLDEYYIPEGQKTSMYLAYEQGNDWAMTELPQGE